MQNRVLFTEHTLDTTYYSLNCGSSCANLQTKWKQGRGPSKGKRDIISMKWGD